MIHDDTITNDDGQETPDRKGSSAAEGGASGVGVPEGGVGVGGSRLPPHAKPLAYNTGTQAPHCDGLVPVPPMVTPLPLPLSLSLSLSLWLSTRVSLCP